MRLGNYAKDCIARYPMTLNEALQRAKPSYANKNMIAALQMSVWNNTIEDEQRLVAAILVERNRSKIYYDGPKNGYKVKD